MSERLDLQAIERRATQAAYEDGLMELLLGGFLVFYGLVMATSSKLAPFAVLVIFLAKPILDFTKRRFIYPRTGYVKLRTEQESHGKGIATATVIFILILLGALWVFRAAMGEQGMDLWLGYFMPAATGIMMAIGPFWLGQNFGLRRGYVLAILFILGGFLVPASGLATGYQAIGLICAILGGLSLATGVVMFSSFLHKYQPEENFYANE